MKTKKHKPPQLIDDRPPGVRAVLAALLPGAAHADFAVARIRLAALDLSASELRSVHCRVLLGRLEADSLDFVASEHTDRERAMRMDALLSFAGSGRLQVRVCCLEEWNPDFSVIRTRPRTHAEQCTTLVGSHYFARPPISGPAFTSIVPGIQAATLASRRFEAIWARGYDVLPVIIQSLERLRAAVAR